MTHAANRPVRRVERDLQAVGRLAQAVLDSEGADALLQEIAEAAKRLVAAKVAMVVTIGGDPEAITLRALAGVSGGPLEVGTTRPLAGTTIADLVRTGSVVVKRGVDEVSAAARPIMEAYQVGPVLGLPIASEGVTRGVLIVGKAIDAVPFRQPDIQLIATFAHQAASAIHLGELRRREAQLTAAAERDRIARDLHDGVVQSLYGLGIGLRTSIARSPEAALLPIVEDAIGGLDDAIGAIRAYIAQLEVKAPHSKNVPTPAPEPPTAANEDPMPRDVIGALGSLAEASVADTSVADVLAQLVSGVLERSDAAYCVLGTLTEDGSFLVIRAVAGAPVPGRHVGAVVPLAETLAAEAIRRGRPVVVSIPEQSSPEMRARIERLRMGPVVSVPMTVRGSVFGGLAVGRRPGSQPFARGEVSMIEAHAVHAAIALEFDRVRGELRRGVLIEERRRVGAELHERVIQTLFSSGLTLQSLEGATRDAPTQATLRSAVDSIDGAILDLRRYVFDLRPPTGAVRQLDHALHALAADLAANTTLDVSVDIDPAVSGMVAGSDAEILQIAREAASNVVRHANARHCLVRLVQENGKVVLEIKDDGRGISVSSINSGHGLRNMRTRAAALGAVLVTRRNPPRGTVVRLTVPSR